MVKSLIPLSNNRIIEINGRKCRNVFFEKEILEKEVKKYFPKKFEFIHGDCTFSNIMLSNDKRIIFIDPRGYFGNTELYGDPAYDWVKLYYSIISNYDQFNLKNFSLDFSGDKVNVIVTSNGWEDVEEYYLSLISDEVSKAQLKLFLSIIWLSLTTYSWDDYDSICAAFYIGLYYFEEALSYEGCV